MGTEHSVLHILWLDQLHCQHLSTAQGGETQPANGGGEGKSSGDHRDAPCHQSLQIPPRWRRTALVESVSALRDQDVRSSEGRTTRCFQGMLTQAAVSGPISTDPLQPLLTDSSCPPSAFPRLQAHSTRGIQSSRRTPPPMPPQTDSAKARSADIGANVRFKPRENTAEINCKHSQLSRSQWQKVNSPHTLKKKKNPKLPQDNMLSIPNYYRRNANQNDNKKSNPTYQ